jgi:hypothetical protein
MRTDSQTLDSNGKLHSFNDEPAEISSYGKTWYKHGVVHRENDLPARIYTRKNDPAGFSWFLDGVSHRGENKPAYISNSISRWTVKGSTHRSDGPAMVYADNIPSQFYLYDLRITEEQHAEVLTYSRLNRFPLWLSFLVSIEAISEKGLKFLSETSNNWTTPLPVTWAIAALRLTDEKLEKAYNNTEMAFSYGFIVEDEIPEIFDRFMKIAQFETSFQA